MKKVFTNTASPSHVKEEPPVKLEAVDTFYGRDGTNCVASDHLENQEYEVYYGRPLRPDYSSGTRARFQYQRRPYRGRGGQQSRGAYNAYNARSMLRGRGGAIPRNSSRQNNPLDSNGEVTRCNVCDSRFHWASDCPDSYENRTKTKSDVKQI